MPLNPITAIGVDIFGGSYPFGVLHRYQYSSLRNRVELAANHYGHGRLVDRQFCRPEQYDIPSQIPFEINDPSGVNEVTFYSKGGAVFGRLRTDIQLGIISQLRFTKRRADCRDFSMTLTRLPDFPIPKFCQFSVQIGGNPDPWFWGRIDQTPRPGHSKVKGFVFEGTGLRDTLARVRKEGVYTAATDVGEVVYQLILQVLEANESDFGFNIGKINRSTGTVLIGDIDVSRATLDKVFDSMASYALCDWGVDGDGDFFFLARRSGVVQKTFFDGYDFSSIEVKEDLRAIRNSLVIKRMRPSGTGELGFTIGAQVSDATSVAKWGAMPEDIKVPSLFTDAECEAFGEVLLDELKDPRVNIVLKGIPIRDGFSVLPRGPHRIVGPFGSITETIQECDDLTTVFKQGSGDLVVSLESANIHDGSSSFSLIYKTASGDRVEMSTDVTSGAMQSLTLWIYSTRLGERYRLWLGDSVYNQFSFDFSIQVVGRFYPVTFDLSSLGVERIQIISLEIINNITGPNPTDTGDVLPVEIFIDSVELTRLGHPHYELETEREVYTLSSDKRAIDVDYGPVPLKLETYIRNVLNIQKDLEPAVETR